MDGKRFDAWAASLTDSHSRRDVLRGLAAGGVATALAAIGARHDEAEAKHRGKHHKRHRKKKAINISTTVNGLLAGAACAVTSDCNAALACAGKKHNKTCQNCTACGNSGKCCLVGVCGLGGDVQICLL